MKDLNKAAAKPSNFENISQGDLPNGRKGKHHLLLMKVLEDLERLPEGRALKIPLADFVGSVADIRSAISRATKNIEVDIATSSDEQFFYVWKPDSNSIATGKD